MEQFPFPGEVMGLGPETGDPVIVSGRVPAWSDHGGTGPVDPDPLPRPDTAPETAPATVPVTIT